MVQVVDGKFLITETSKGRLYVYLEEYSGKTMLHIRYWYRDKKNETADSGTLWAPSAKGIALPPANINALLQVLPLVLKPIKLEPPKEEPVKREDPADVYG